MTEVEVARHDRSMLAEIGRLRMLAWGPVVGDSAATARFGVDHHDDDAWHVVRTNAGRLSAAGRLVVRNDAGDLPDPGSFDSYSPVMRFPVGFAGRLVVHPEERGRGLGESIIAARLTLAAELGVSEVWGETRTDQVEGLRRHGYEVVGPSDDHTVPGTWTIMRATLSSSDTSAATDG
jgi:GNAT superfamily N-acetyltransferase